jgi:hypothetical protein
MSLHPIEGTLAKLALLREDGRGLFMAEPDSQPGWCSVADLATEHPLMEDLFKGLLSHYQTTKLRPPAMFWFGHYAYNVELITFACFLVDGRVPDLSLNKLSIRFGKDMDIENLAWHGRSFAALTDDPDASHPDCIVLPTREALRKYMQKQLIANFTPMIESVSSYSTLGKPGLWEIAADYAAFAFAALGEIMGDESLGVRESRLFAEIKSKLSLRRQFISIEHIGSTHYMLERTSCCLYYQVKDGVYCHSCPHRPMDERIELVKKHMEEEAAQAAA